METTPGLATWADLERDQPELATVGRRLFDRDGIGQAFLATVRGQAAPRIHPIYVEVVDGHLYAFIGRSTKRIDLERDGRYALHAHQDPAAPSEFTIRGRTRPVDDRAVRTRVAAVWSFEPDDGYALFEFLIESAVVGSRDGPDEWPPRYAAWTADTAAARS
jgi:hypothetical protein